MTSLERISNWYLSQCNGDWEHSFGVEVQTLDNPGWFVKIDLAETELEEKLFSALVEGDSASGPHWINCKVESKQFLGAGGAGDLERLLDVFLSWSED
jgi:Immunity protein 53